MPKPTTYIVWELDGATRYVPSWAPDRIQALAVLRFPAAKIRATLPEGATSWHPAVD